ncbi:hypothetical protein AGDE_10325 [Angomonas deanei]|nr:hypothetical protein AGDE_10325 [Angomonas deanei]|eukprot:EPY28702.1 hypothetical protein AGDE_10325 [Angomonas deanei]
MCGSPKHMQSSCPMKQQLMECFQCHQLGHGAVTCPLTRCYNCGTYGHSSQICSSKPYCFHCAHQGHRSLDCPLRTRGRVCYQCNRPGHDAAECPKGQLCRMCQQPGHFIAHCPLAVCYACNEKGHTSSVCEKVHCSNCGGQHETTHCRQPAGEQHDTDSDSAPSTHVPTDHPAAPAGDPSYVVPPYTPSGEERSGRVAVVIDGPYFERCMTKKGLHRDTSAYYTTTAEALAHTLQYIGDILHMEPFAFWFDTDPDAFNEFVETAIPLAHRAQHLTEAALRKRFLTDEMNADHSLKNVIAKLVGGMKRQRGYTQDGPGHVWVQSGVDVAIATCIIEQFQSHRFDQVVLLAGDVDLYPSVHFCNTSRTSPTTKHPVPSEKSATPVRVCGSSTSISKIYGQEQHISDFLPKILLDKPHHVEGTRKIEFPTHTVFC